MFSSGAKRIATAKRALVAASLGWMLDAFDVMLYALVLHVGPMTTLSLDRRRRRRPAVADAAGVRGRRPALRRARRSLGPHARADAERADLFGVHGGVRVCADRRCSSRCSASSSASAWAASGRAAPRSCPRPGPTRDRGKALGLHAELVGDRLRPRRARRTVSCRTSPASAGARCSSPASLPALFAFWVRRSVEEPAMWRESRAGVSRVSIGAGARRRPMLGVTLALTLMNACTMFAWWGFNTVGAVVPAVARRSACRARR